MDMGIKVKDVCRVTAEWVPPAKVRNYTVQVIGTQLNGQTTFYKVRWPTPELLALFGDLFTSNELKKVKRV